MLSIGVRFALMPLLGIIVLFLWFWNVKCAYRLPKSARKQSIQLLLNFGVLALLAAQFYLLDLFVPENEIRLYVAAIAFCECGGGIIVMVCTAFYERGKMKKI